MPNAIDRYAISDHTSGAEVEAGGAFKIHPGCNDPGGSRSANWLPTPCGPYNTLLRPYLPTDAARAPAFSSPGPR